MTIVDKTDRSQTDAIAFEIELGHPPAKVWRALTDPTLLAEWLLPAIGFTLEQGVAFTFKTQPHPGWDGTVNCRVLEFDEHKKLSYAWVVGEEKFFFLDTVVTFTLTPVGEGTRLVIVQSGFQPDQKQNFGGARYGWKMMGGKLVDLLGRTA